MAPGRTGDEVDDLLETDAGGPKCHHDPVAMVAAAIDLAIAARLCGVIGGLWRRLYRFRRAGGDGSRHPSGIT